MTGWTLITRGATACKWGRALDCGDRDVNLYLNLERNLIPRAGTLECWVKSGVANIWADGEDHCLFRLTPRRAMRDGPRTAVTVDLTKRGEDNALHLSMSGGVVADLAVSTAELDAQAWHHVAFSWDFTGEASRLWLSLDGTGQRATLATDVSPLPFVSLQVGNTHWLGHYAHPGEFSPFGGLVDDLHISDETLARRESGYAPLDIGELDVELGLAAEDALDRWLGKWAGLQMGGAWGPWFTPILAESEVAFDWTKRPTDMRVVDMKYGGSGVLAHRFLRAWESTGDEAWLQVAHNTGEFLLRGQDERGHWTQVYVVDESGGVKPASNTNVVRVQDGFQSQPWMLMLSLHRATGDERYFAAATRCADLLLSIENANGSWPDFHDLTKSDDEGDASGTGGVRAGGSYNDGATTDPMRMMMTMYLLTRDEKYLKGPEGSRGIAGIGQWMFDTQMGEGEVRGWCQQYDHDNKPVWARGFEAPVMSPRVVCRFIYPICLYMYLMTGNERYMNLLQETYDWYRSVEVPGEDGGWYYQYLPDGTPCTTSGYETVAIDPTDPNAPKPSRGKLQLGHVEEILTKYREMAPEDFRQSFVGSAEISADEYARLRRSAADYCRSHADEVRGEIAAQLPDGTLCAGSHLRAPHRVATYEYVMNLHLARGVVPPATLRCGGQAPWDGAIAGRGGWSVPVVWFPDWFDIPLEDKQ